MIGPPADIAGGFFYLIGRHPNNNRSKRKQSSDIDIKNMMEMGKIFNSKEELIEEITKLTALKNELKNEEQAVKLTMNSVYGAIGNSYFVCQNPDVAEAVTLQGQDLIKFAEKIINKYFNEHWHLDKELHEKIGLTTVKRVAKPLVIYIDTDSSAGDTKVNVSLNGNTIISKKFEDLFDILSEIYPIEIDYRDNEIIKPNLWVTNYKEKSYCLSSVRKIIRHKVRKEKWEIVTASGKKIHVTGDHSIMVERNGKLISVKPSEIDIEKDIVIEEND